MLLHWTEPRALQTQQIIRFGFQFITSWVLIRIVSDSNILAEYESITILSAGFSAALVFGLIQKLIQSQNESIDTIRTLSRLGFLFSVFIAMLVIGIGLFSPKIEHHYALFWAAGTLALHLPSFLLDQWLIIQKKYTFAVGMTFFSYFLPFISTITLVFFHFSLSFVFFSLFCIALAKWLILIYLTYNIPTQPLLQHGKPVLTLIAIFLVAALAEMFDQWLIQQFCSSTDLILFRYGARELPISLVFANAFSTYVSTSIAKNPSEDFSGWLKKENAVVCHQIFIPTLILLLCSNRLFYYLYPASIQNAVFIFDCFLLLAIPRTTFPQSILLAYGLNHILFKITLAETIIHIALTLALFPFVGIYAAVISTGIAYSFEKTLLLYTCYNFKLNPKIWFPWKVWIFYSCVLIGTYLIKWFVA